MYIVQFKGLGGYIICKSISKIVGLVLQTCT